MKFSIKTRILSSVLGIALFAGMLSGVNTPRSYADSIQQLAILDAKSVSERFSESIEFVENELTNGYSINQIYAIFMKAELEGSDYGTSKSQLFPDEINLSENTESEVSNAQLPHGLVLVDADVTVTGTVYDPQFADETVTENVYEAPANHVDLDATVDEELTHTEGNEGENVTADNSQEVDLAPEQEKAQTEQSNQSALSNDVSVTELQEDSMMMVMSTGGGAQEEAPVYDKNNISQEPYRVDIKNESISSLSGDLSLEQTDMTLPGRNDLSFELTRQYSASDAALYDIDHGTEPYPVDVYRYYVRFNTIKKQQLFDVRYRESRYVQEDYDGNGTIDYETMILDWYDLTNSTYTAQASAQQRANQGVYYTTPSESRTETSYLTSGTNSFQSSIYYSQAGFTGYLYKQGSSYVSSGSYTAAHSKTVTSTCDVRKYGKYNAQGVWVKTSEDPACPSSKSYNSGGYAGTLNRTTTDTLNTCPASGGTPNASCTGHWRANYSGTVTKPASDTRVYRQDYSGTVTKSGTSSTTKYGSWTNGSGSYKWRYVYFISNVRVVEKEGTATAGTRDTAAYDYYSDAVYVRDDIQSSANAYIGTEGGYNYYISSSPGATIMSQWYGTTTGYRYVNLTKQPLKEKLYPIGKGWSWKLPFVEKEGSKTYVHLADGGRHEVENGALKDATWLGLSFTEDTSVVVSGGTSKYMLSSVDGNLKQYFTNDGFLLQIRDGYNNTITFTYAQHPGYNRKLLSRVTDAIGNYIDISYTTTAVTITKGNETVVYQKAPNSGTEVLQAVVDAEGRQTTYSYDLKPAKFNLMGYDDSRAKSNPYMLLSRVQHPTGAKTHYGYESSPVRRYIGESSFIEGYRVNTRSDELLYANNTSEFFNQHSIMYTGDYQQAHGTSYTTSSTLNNGRTSTTFNYRKAYVNDSQPTQFYLDSQVESGEGLIRTTSHSYSKMVGSRTYAVAQPTTTVVSNNKTPDTLTTTTQYDDYGNVTQSSDPLGAVTAHTYDSVKKWLSTTLQQIGDNRYLHTTYNRNAQGDVLEMTVRKQNANGEIVKQTINNNINAHGNVTQTTIVNGTKPQVYAVEYDTLTGAYPVREHIQVKNAEGAVQTITTELEYDSATGRIQAAIDGKGYRTEYDYDKLGRIKLVKYPDLATLSVVYNDTQNTVTLTDELGRQSRTQWNGLGWKQEEGLFGSSGYEVKDRTGYDVHGRIKWEEDAAGNRTSFDYDAWSRPTRTTYADLTSEEIQYLDQLMEVHTIDALSNVTIDKLDKHGRSIQTEEQAVGESRMLVSQKGYYPYSGWLHWQKDAKGEQTTFAYDDHGQITSVTNAKSEITQFRYDMLGNHVKTIFPDGNESTKVYDELGRLLESVDPLGKKDTYYYDANDNQSKLIDKTNRIFLYEYTKRDWLKKKIGPTETIEFNYRLDGSKEWMSDRTGRTAYAYHPYTGDLETVTYPDNRTIQYTYNNRDLRQTMTTPYGDMVEYDYNVTDQLKSLKWNGTKQAEYQYKTNGKLWKLTQGATAEAERTYRGGLLKELKHLGLQGSLNRVYTYDYDANYNTNGIVESEGGIVTRDQTLTYDKLDRVETSSEFNETYSYDIRGNRKTLLSEGGVHPPENVALEYDEWDRLTKVTRLDGSIVTYRYNGDNLLVERTENGETIRYYYDDQEIVAEGIVQQNGNTVEKVSYLRGNELAMLEEADGTKGYYVVNGHGDVTDILGANGALLNSYTYDIWGNVLSSTETVDNSFWYSGEYWDETTELQYLRARWYDPGTGRFINEDTYEGQLNDPLTLNLYTYGHNNPLLYQDPSGHFVFLAPLVIYAAKVVAKTAVDVAIDYGKAKATGQSFNLGKSVVSNGAWNLVPGGGAINSARKVVKTAGVVQSTAKSASKTVSKGTGNAVSGKDTLKPGKHASKSIPARGKGRDFTKEERNKINEIGQNTGCHTCGSKKPGTKSGNFIPDHQPPNSRVPNGTPQQLYPHCKSCSSKQGGTLGAMKKQEQATRRR